MSNTTKCCKHCSFCKMIRGLSGKKYICSLKSEKGDYVFAPMSETNGLGIKQVHPSLTVYVGGNYCCNAYSELASLRKVR